MARGRLAASAAIVAAAVAGCGGAADHRSEYTQADRQAFVARCVDSGDTQVFCDCTIDVLSERLSRGEYNDLLEADAAGAGFAGLPDDSEGEAREALDEVSASCG